MNQAAKSAATRTAINNMATTITNTIVNGFVGGPFTTGGFRTWVDDDDDVVVRPPEVRVDVAVRVVDELILSIAYLITGDLVTLARNLGAASSSCW